MSIEVDILPMAETKEETARLAGMIEGVAGEFSTFEQLHGFSITVSTLGPLHSPKAGASDVKVQNTNTAAPAGEPGFTGWCLDKEDLCAAKLIAFREKDLNFVAALLDARLVEREDLIRRLETVAETYKAACERARSWLASREPR
jgi:hypothetical protein